MAYVVNQYKKFCKAIRQQAAKTLSCEKQKNLDQFITLEQCRQILEKNCINKDNQGRFIVNEDCYLDMLFEISRQIYQSALSKLASEDIIQCSWDDKKNEMTFWIIDENGYRKIKSDPE